jgi:hypothetical protein
LQVAAMRSEKCMMRVNLVHCRFIWHTPRCRRVAVLPARPSATLGGGALGALPYAAGSHAGRGVLQFTRGSARV